MFRGRAVALASALGALPAVAQDVPELEAVVVTATRVEQTAMDVPASIDVVPGAALRDLQPRVNLSEGMGRVPGLVMQNRYNFAQDLQVSSRGFGARAQFGTRGVRLVQDGIPLTMPDGQGQTALFDLDSAKRVEVLRGPFAALYGNSAGGVITAFTDDGPATPFVEATGGVASFDTWRAGVRAGGAWGDWRGRVDAARFMTDGYRDHSAATRDQGNVRLRHRAGDDAVLTVIVNTLDQPRSLDPLGLTQAQLQQNRRQAGTGAVAFDTGKTVRHDQAGLAYERRLGSEDTLYVRGYGGHREVQQFLAFTGAAPTSSGGVVNLDRDFGGGGLQWVRRGDSAAGGYMLTAGLDYEGLQERRKGFVNNFGQAGALRRDEDDRVTNTGAYLIGEWQFAPRWKLSGGLRYSSVRFSSEDLYITPQNPDDSGAARYAQTSPVAGLLYELTPAINVYASAGRGFETPTLAELAYRPDGRPGLNFALQPATSRNYEAGVKALLGDTAYATLAVFRIDVDDEIVNGPQLQPGRNTFVNAAATRRTGLELALQARFGGGFFGALAWTWLEATFQQASLPGGQSFAGNQLPGVPAQVLYGELEWRHAATGFVAVVEGRYASQIYADDANNAAASSYAVFNARAGVERRFGPWRVAGFVRLDNALAREYVGSVIVNAANAQYYEPAPQRQWWGGVTVAYAF
jgi:iron complex outermembrane receptor protein